MTIHYIIMIDIASCTTSVYVNLSKNSFFELLPHLSARKRMQSYTFLANLQNFSSIFFRKSVIFTFFMESNECQRALHLTIYIISCGVWNEECGVRNVSSTSGLKYEYFISELFSLHTPHSTLHKTAPHSTKKTQNC